MKEKIVLVFDVGTQSSRALLINNRGERNADLYFADICACSRDLKERYPELFGRIEAASVTTIRDTVVCLDKDRKPLRPAILWLDRRTAKGGPEFPGSKKLLLKAARIEDMVRLQYQKSHCNWLMQNEPDVWERTDKYVLLSGYLIYCLTGELVDAAASMVGHIPFDNKTRGWQQKGSLTRPIYDVPESKLCRIAET